MLTASLSSIPETDEHWPNKFSFLSTCNDDNDANKLKQQHNRQSSAPEKARSGSGAFLQLVALLANVAHFRTRHDASLQILRHARRVGVHQSQQELFEAQRRHFKPVKLVSGLADETVVKVHRLFNRLVDDEKQNPLLAEAPGWGVDTAQVAADGRLEATSMHVPRLTLEPEPAEQTVIFGFTRNLPAHLNRKTNLFFFVKNQIYSHAFSFRGAVILISVLPDCSYFEIRSTSDNFECKLMGVDVEFIFCTFIYIFIVLAAVAPPDELVSLGFTAESFLKCILREERASFIDHHILRTSGLILIRSFLPYGYMSFLTIFVDNFTERYLKYHIFWSFYLFVSYIIIAFAVGAIVYYQKDDWSGHPIVKRLRTYDSNWRNVAAAIDEEYKDMEKFLVGLGTTRVIVTNNWIILIDAWSVHLINQRDAVLCVSGVDTYDRSSSGLLETQYVNIRVASVTNPMKPFTLRINSLLFVDLLSKLTAPIHHVTDLNIPVKIEDRFQIIFEHTANSNLRYDQTQWQAEECCIGCFQCVPLVKLLKNCKNDDAEVDEEGNVLMPCSPCKCRPMWCLSCMGKWFVSRQDFRRPRNWTVGRSPCPTCRAPFCLNDVCLPVADDET
ncbi:Transmembrane protein [Trichinella pseudospiralis]|uniref:Transmembrane protein n=2 Tax=Trichinella pseudospiralis TaxID=6337 RepID=A0A0V1HKN7_TRIPS|nr:Transmembrane protein [Trichinella pseudospiralis]